MEKAGTGKSIATKEEKELKTKLEENGLNKYGLPKGFSISICFGKYAGFSIGKRI